MKFGKILLALSALACFSSLASATSIGVSNTGGTFSSPLGGLQLSGAQLTFVSGLGVPYSGNVSADTTALNFSIGAPTTGTVASGSATWTTGGGTFSFSDSTTGLVFNGTFTCSASSKCTWAGSSGAGVFSASFDGTLNGQQITGLTAQINFTNANGGFSSATVVPEVGTLAMVGMGLLGMAGFVKLKLSSAMKRAGEQKLTA